MSISPLSKITKIFSFSFFELKVFITSWFLYLKWDHLITRSNYKKWQAHIVNQEDAITPSTEPASKYQSLQTIIKINEMAGRNHLKHMNCLRRCLCQKELLSKYKIQSKLHLGVKFVDGKLAAHSWLSSNDAIINDSKEVVDTYQELKTLNDAQTLSLLK